MTTVACAAFVPASSALGAAGDLDPSFAGDGLVTTNLTPGSDALHALAIQADGKIVVAGRTGGGGGQFVVARYTTTGTLDATFSGDGIARTNFSPGNDEAAAVAIQADGKIVVAGSADLAGTPRFALARYDAGGALDPTFSGNGRVETAFPTGASVALGVAIQGNAKIVAAGIADRHDGSFAVARYDPNGSLDAGFGGDGMVTTTISSALDFGEAVAIEANGRIVAAGFAGGAGRPGLVRYTTTGALDPTFSGDGKAVLPVGGAAAAVAVRAGKIVVAGDASLGRFAVFRVNSDGSPDSGFGDHGAALTKFPHTTAGAGAVAIQVDGKVVAAGLATGAGGRFALARYTTAGALDPTFGGDGRVLTNFTSGDDEAAGVAIQADGRIVAAGFAAGLGGRLALARYLG